MKQQGVDEQGSRQYIEVQNESLWEHTHRHNEAIPPGTYPATSRGRQINVEFSEHPNSQITLVHTESQTLPEFHGQMNLRADIT